MNFVSKQNSGSVPRPLPQHNAVRSRAPDNEPTPQTDHGFNRSPVYQNNGQSSDLNIIKIDPEINLMDKAHNCDKTWTAIKGMQNAKPLDLQVYRGIWGGMAKQQFNTTDPIGRYLALQSILKTNDLDASRTRIKRRMASLLGSHELEAIHKSLDEQSRDQGINTRKLAIDELARRGNKDERRIVYENTKRRHYVSVFERVGPGALGEQGNSVDL